MGKKHISCRFTTPLPPFPYMYSPYLQLAKTLVGSKNEIKQFKLHVIIPIKTCMCNIADYEWSSDLVNYGDFMYSIEFAIKY